MIKDQIEELIEPTLKEMDLILWGCDYLSQGRHSLLRVYIDKEGGVEITDCERASRQISAILDVEDPISGNYNLEISSPGIPRPLFKQWQYKQYLGREIQLKLFRPLDGRRNWTGLIKEVDDQAVTLSLDGEEQKFLFSNIVRAYLTDE